MTAGCTEKALEFNTEVFARYGSWVAGKAGSLIMFSLGLIVAIVLSVGIYRVEYENELDNLWVEEGSRAADEADFFTEHFGGGSRLNLYMLQTEDKRHTPNADTDFGLLTAENFLNWRDITQEAQQSDVGAFTITATLPVSGTQTSVNISLGDLCDRPLVPPSLKPWTNSFGGTSFLDARMTLGWLSTQATDAGGLVYLTQCLSAQAAIALTTKDNNTVTPLEYAQLQMWYQQDVMDLLQGTDNAVSRGALALSRPGLANEWGIARFPCTRANALDCYQEGIYDYPSELQQLNAYGYSIAALSDSLTVANFTGSGVLISGVPLESLFKPRQLHELTSDTEPYTWLELCIGGMTQSIKDAVRLSNGGEENGALENATSAGLISQFQSVGLKSAIGLGFWWRPTIESANTSLNAFAYSFYEGQRNAQERTADVCVAEGLYRQMASIKRHPSDTFAPFPFYAIADATPMNGGCCIAWSGTKVTSALYSGGQIPSPSAFNSSSNPDTFQGFLAALRITNSNINQDNPFFQQRLTDERGIDTLTPTQREDLPRAWEKQLISTLEDLWDRKTGSGFANGEEYNGLQFNFLVDRSINDLFDDASNVETHLLAIGYVVLIAYACGTFVQFGTDSSAIVYSRGCLCFVGICIIGLSTAASYGLVSWANLTLSPVNSTLVPFLSMGLGIDDLFVIMHEYVRTHAHQDNVHTRIVETMMSAGSSVTVTSAANVAAFLIPAIIVKLPAVYTFSYQMAAAILLNWVMLMALFCPILVADATRSAKRLSIIPGVATNVKESTIQEKASKLSMAKFVENYLAPMYATIPFKVTVLLVWIAMTIWLPLHGADNTEDGLRLSDVTIKGSYVKDYLTEQELLFPIIPGDMITRQIDYVRSTDSATVNLAGFQENILQWLRDGESNAYLDITPPPIDTHWLPDFISTYNQFSDAVLMGVFGVSNPALYPRPAETVPEDLFYPVLAFYLSGVGATRADALICRTVATGALGNCFNVDGSTVVVAATKGSVYFKDLFDDPDFIEAIKTLRKTSDNSDGNLDACCNSVNNGTRFDPTNIYFNGYLFKFWQQYVTIGDLTIKTIGFAVLGIAVVLLIFQASPWSSILVVIFLLSSVLQLYGIMAFFDIKLNGFSVTNMSIGLGMGVEFTAHIAYAFLRANAVDSDKDKRVAIALVEIFPPMISGAITTFISVVVLAFAKYPFFRTYFFEMIALIILITFVNGMVFLPVVLSLVGPRGLTAEDLKEIEEAAEVKDADLADAGM